MTIQGMILVMLTTFSACGIAIWRAHKLFISGKTKDLEGWPRLKIALQNGIIIGLILIWVIQLIAIFC